MFPAFCLSSTGVVNATATGAAGAFNAGLGYVGSRQLVSTSTAASDTFQDGFARSSGGALRVYDATAGLPSPVYYNEGIATTKDGQVCYTSNSPSGAVAYLDGAALTSDGRVYMSIV